MKVLAKPISSPSRTDNFPPPLLRFLRSNGGSKSRGKSRSSPMFIRKRSEIQATQEPSSPEVTCMGQVRGSVSMKKRKKLKKKKNRCEWIQNTLFCRHLDRNTKKSNPKVSTPVWRRWGTSFYQKKVEIKEEESTITVAKQESSEEEEDDEEITEAFVTPKTPPKNALLLMRCRSEPYRASSLANRFWGSPEKEKKLMEEEEVCTLKTESSCRDSIQESRTDSETEEKLGFCQGFESSSESNQRIEISKVQAPLLLTRCKSEPGRRSEKFEPDMCFWKMKLGVVDSSNSTTRC